MKALEAVIFDTDGVVTRTAAVHFAAWKRVFDAYLGAHATGAAAREFTDADYREFVDGVGRYDGVERLLASRGIELPHGDPGDPPGDATVCAVANTKNAAFEQTVAETGVEPYATTRRLIESLHEAGIRTAVISASRNCEMVLARAGMDDLFEVRVDGIDQARQGFPGKPEPDVFVEAASRLGVDPARCAVVEDAISGVTAGRNGGFGLVIGLDRSLNPAPLARHADLVVPDAADLEVAPCDGGGHGIARRIPAASRIRDLPNALVDHDFDRRTSGRRLALFCDYDGTLAPIVERPEDAVAAPELLAVLDELAGSVPVAIVSGRDLDDVRSMVSSDRLWFAGSHGFDVCGPEGERHELDVGESARPALDSAQQALTSALGPFGGAWLERKRYAIAIHFRAMADELEGELRALVAAEADQHDGLRLVGGKKIFELRPDVDWHKGRALRWLLGAMGLVDPDGAGDVVPLFLGDDVTDEDGFAEIRLDGVGVIVAESDDRLTAAHDRLSDPAEVLELLELLARKS